MAFGHLVENLDPLAFDRRVVQGQLHAAHGVADVDEGAGLTGAMHGQRIANGRLHQEAVQHRAVVAVVIKAICQAWIAVGGFGVGSQTIP